MTDSAIPGTSANPRVRVPDTDSLNGLLACPSMLLELTFDQLRTLVVVQEAGSANGAARILGREQSSVQKQIDTLNRSFQRMCGELLAIRQGRGQPFRFTQTGTAVTKQADATLADWQGRVNDARRRIGKTLAIGATEFTLPFIGKVWQRVCDAQRIPSRAWMRGRSTCCAAGSPQSPVRVTSPETMNFCNGSAMAWCC